MLVSSFIQKQFTFPLAGLCFPGGVHRRQLRVYCMSPFHICHPRVMKMLIFTACFLALHSTHAQDLERLGAVEPLHMNGAVGATLTSNSMSGMDRRQQPFSWLVSGASTADLYGVSIPFSFTISERDRSYQQPFSEFGLSPTYKWATLHLGWRSMSWSRYTNAGIRFLGAGVELQPKDFVCAAMYGRLQRAVADDSTNRYAIPAYRRTGGGVMLLFGNDQGNARTSFFMAGDDTTSLAHAPAGVLPQQNAVLGAGFLFQIIDGVSLDMDIGGSLFTRNLYSPSLEKGGIAGGLQARRATQLRDYYSVLSSTTLAFAGRASLAAALPQGGVQLTAELIEPDYMSLGAYTFESDVFNLTVAPTWMFLDGRLRTAASLGMQRDNIAREKTATTTRWIGSIMANIDPAPEYGFGINYSNYASGQTGARMPLNDSIRVRNVNESFGVSGRTMLSSAMLRHMFIVTAQHMAFTDLNAYTSMYTGTRSTMALLSYTLAHAQLPRSITGSFSHANTHTTVGTMRVTTVSTGGATTFLDDKLQASLMLGYSRVAGDAYGSSQVITEGMSLTWATPDGDHISLSITGNQNRGGTRENPQFQELTSTLSYQRGFSWHPFAPQRP